MTDDEQPWRSPVHTTSADVTAGFKPLNDMIVEAYERGVAAGRRRAAADLRAYALNYPESVFPPDSDSRDATAGTAMRHAYTNASRIAEGTEPDTEAKPKIAPTKEGRS